MAHVHSLYDTDPHFRIDPATRNIVNMSGKVVLIQHDHNSERFTFEIPRYVDGHDMSMCNVVEVHYINGSSSQKVYGLYPVADLQVDPNDEKYVICSWLLSRNCTELVGALNFMLRFKCTTGETIDYDWGTNIHSGITISQGIYNSDYIADEYVDVLEQWKNDLEGTGVTMTGIEQTVTSTEDNGVNEVTMSFSNNTTGTFEVRNGSKGTSIRSIARTSGNGAAGTTDTYTVTLTDGSTSTFQVRNGADFKYSDFTTAQLAALTGPTGASIKTIARTSGNGAAGTTDTYTVTLTNGNTSTFQVYNGADFKYKDFTAAQLSALTGPQGVSIKTIARTAGTGAAGTTDTYTITLTDNTTTTFQVYNGADGKGAGDMLKSIYDPKNKSTDVFTYVDNAIGNVNTILDTINGEVV